MNTTRTICTIFSLLISVLLINCSGERSNQDEQSEQPDVQAMLEVKEWPVPWEDSRPRDPYVAPDGKVWFCGQAGNYLASFDPATEEFKRFEVPERSNPHNLIIDDEGFVWYAGNLNAHIGKLDPADGSITQFPMPDPEARDPHTLVFNQEGNIWFTVQGGNFIGYLNTTTGEVKLVSVPTPKARPYGIKMDPQNQPWVVLFGTNKLATIDPSTFELKEIELPDSTSRPRRLEIKEGLIYYADYSKGYVGRYDTNTGSFAEWPLPGGRDSRPYGTAMDHQGIIWIAEAGLDPNRLVGFDPGNGSFVGITEIPSGGGVIRHMYFDSQKREIWFGTDTNNLGRASLVQQGVKKGK